MHLPVMRIGQYANGFKEQVLAVRRGIEVCTGGDNAVEIANPGSGIDRSSLLCAASAGLIWESASRISLNCLAVSNMSLLLQLPVYKNPRARETSFWMEASRSSTAERNSSLTPQPLTSSAIFRVKPAGRCILFLAICFLKIGIRVLRLFQ